MIKYFLIIVVANIYIYIYIGIKMQIYPFHLKAAEIIVKTFIVNLRTQRNSCRKPQ